MSTTAYDLGRRLRASREGKPTSNLAHAPCLPPERPVAVHVATTPDGVQVTATTDTDTRTMTGPLALSALAEIGVGLDEIHRTIVVADHATMYALATLARQCATNPDLAAVAATVGWWAGRSEHPGSGAVIVLLDALRARWTLGVEATRERELSTWAPWLNRPESDGALLLALARQVASGTTLPGLLTMHGSDTASWSWLREHATTWHYPDGRGQAALGLTTRCDAADLYASLLLDDPLMAARAAFTGEVVTGTVVSVSPLIVRADRPLSRLRVGTDVDTWPGEAHQVALTALSGRIGQAQISPSGDLDLTITETRKPAIEAGARLTLRPRRVSARQQQQSRRERVRRHAARSNWLATRECPPPARREVPLDIAIAAAD